MAEAKKTSIASSRSKQTQRMGEPASKKLMRIILMIACCAGSFYFFWTTLQMITETENVIIDVNNQRMAPDPAAEVERQEIASAEEGLSNLTKASSQAMRVALLAEVQSKFPIDLSSSLIVPVASNRDFSEPVIEPDPPMVSVVAIMITDNDKVALVNVDGEQGVLVRQGTKFSDGTARITKIDAKGVTFIWMKKSYQVSL
jgi:hypothetical protein